MTVVDAEDRLGLLAYPTLAALRLVQQLVIGDGDPVLAHRALALIVPRAHGRVALGPDFGALAVRLDLGFGSFSAALGAPPASVIAGVPHPLARLACQVDSAASGGV